MAHIHLVGGEKGGVGKSLVARLLAQYMIDRQMPFIGFDSDRSHGALMRFYAGYAAPVRVDSEDTLDGVIEAALEDPDRRVLVDLAAQTHQPLQRWIEGAGVLELAAEHGLVLHYWHVMDNGRDAVDLLGLVLEQFGPAMQHVLVRNPLRGDDGVGPRVAAAVGRRLGDAVDVRTPVQLLPELALDVASDPLVAGYEVEALEPVVGLELGFALFG